MSTVQAEPQIAEPVLRGGLDRGWRFPMSPLARRGRRAPEAAQPSIRSAWLRFAGDRPKLAAQVRGV